MTSLPHRLERTIDIDAPREAVFRFFTDTPRWAAWWGPGSTIDARPGGPLLIVHPGGVEVRGDVIEIAPPERIVFTYGYASGRPIPTGGSRVTIHLAKEGRGTRLRLVHEFAEAAARDHHVQGWRYQLSLFANVVLDELHAGAADKVDGWFGAWSEPDDAARAEKLAAIAVPDVRFRDRFSLVAGVSDLVPHLAAAQRFMPGLRLRRTGDVRHCQGTALADWAAVGADGQERGRGTNVFTLGADGRIESVTGFWAR